MVNRKEIKIIVVSITVKKTKQRIQSENEIMKNLVSDSMLKRKIWKVKKVYVTIIATLFGIMLTSPTFNHVIGLHKLTANNFTN